MASDYCTAADVKALAGATLTTDDALIAVLVTRASAMIDAHTGRRFVERTETRYYTPGVDTEGRFLLVDDDLLSVTTLTNGDGAVIPAVTGYLTYPLNRSPKIGIMLKTAYSWYTPADAEGAIAVAGTWGYCTAATRPADVTQAAARLTLWLYRQREAPFNRIGNSITGEYEVPTALPDDVKFLLVPYVRVEVGGV